MSDAPNDADDRRGAPSDVADALDLANQVLAHHLGSKARSLVHEAGGETNVVFRAEHESGEFVIRIGAEPSRLADFHKEQWVIDRVRAEGVPTAQVLEVGDHAIGMPYMLLHRVRGRPATTHPERMRILEELGAHAATINRIATDGFGRRFDWAREKLLPRATWDAFLLDELSLDDRLELLVRERMITRESGSSIRSAVVALGDRRRAPRLNHGDLRLKNAIVDEEGAIQAILDWETAVGGPAPEWELSLALHDLSVDEKEAFTSGYGIGPDALKSIAASLKALNIVNYAPYIKQAADAGDEEQLARFRARLGGALDLFSI